MDTTGVASFDEEGAGGREFGSRTAATRKGDGGSGDSPPNALPATIVANARLSEGSLALSEALTALSGASVQPDHHTVSEDGDRSLILSILGVSEDDVEAAFVADPTVEMYQLVQAFPDRRTYQVLLEESAILIAPTSLELGARVTSVEGRNGEWHASFQFPSRESLIALRAFCEANDISFSLDSLSETDSLDTDTGNLSELQREILRTAYESGYFDVPRTFSQADLAAELDVSTSAVSNRLRRATAQLICDRFGPLDR